MRFLPIFLSSVHRIDFKLHIMIVLNDLDKVLNVSQHMSVVIGHARLINYAKMGFSKGFCHFLDFGDSD